MMKRITGYVGASFADYEVAALKRLQDSAGSVPAERAAAIENYQKCKQFRGGISTAALGSTTIGVPAKKTNTKAA